MSRGKKEKKMTTCDYCNKKFTYEKSFENHIKSVHNGEKTNRCDMCEETFWQMSSLESHILSVHWRSQQQNGCPELAAELEQPADTAEQLCKKCKKDPQRKCKECGCTVCGSRDDAGKQLFCEECEFSK